MRNNVITGLALIIGISLFSVISASPSKVQVCHIPPDNPDNFHTITVSEKALNSHLGHGDLLGTCSNFSEQLCDDGDACTIDAFDPGTETCAVTHPPVDCNDSDLCTTDSCDTADGCQYAPIVCDDGDACTVDFCNAGECLAATIDCGELALCDPDTGCYDPCGGISCEPIDACHQPGECVFPGECTTGVPVPDDTPCDDGNSDTTDDRCVNGLCEGSPACEPFEILALEPTNNAATSFAVAWHTETPSSSLVTYANYNDLATQWTVYDPALVTDHYLTLTGLTPFTIYSFVAESESSCGYIAVSEDVPWRTLR